MLGTAEQNRPLRLNGGRGLRRVANKKKNHIQQPSIHVQTRQGAATGRRLGAQVIRPLLASLLASGQRRLEKDSCSLVSHHENTEVATWALTQETKNTEPKPLWSQS